MAELMFPDIAGSFMRGQQFGTQMRQEREGEQRRSRLAELASQAYSAPQEERRGILGQMVGVDPEAGLGMSKSLQGEDEVRNKTIGNAARLLASAPEASRPALYAQMRGEMSRYIPNMPEQYDATVEQAAQAIARAYSGADETTPSTIRELQMLQANPELYKMDIARRQAGWQPKIFESADGMSVFNPQQGAAAPLNYGGGAPAQPMPRAPAQGESPNQEAVLVRANQMVSEGVPPEQIDAYVQQALSQPVATGGGQPQGGALPPALDYQNGGTRVMPKVKAPSVPAGYRALPDGSLAPIPGGPAQIAIDARADAAAARKAAEDVKAAQKAQAAAARQTEASEAANQLVSAIDTLTNSEGFSDLGTAMGDIKINTPLIRSGAKDAQAQLENIAGQVALTTMAKLKALSSAGATGFGALSAPELKLLENAIATLQSDEISNAELKSSLKTIRDKMDKTTQWKPEQSVPAGNAGPAPASSNAVLRWNPATGDFE